MQANGVNEVSEDPFGIKIFPNPFNGTFNLTLMVKDKNHTSVKLKDALGREVWVLNEKSLNTGVNTIEINPATKGISGGVYFLEISDPVVKIIRKVISN